MIGKPSRFLTAVVAVYYLHTNNNNARLSTRGKPAQKKVLAYRWSLFADLARAKTSRILIKLGMILLSVNIFVIEQPKDTSTTKPL